MQRQPLDQAFHRFDALDLGRAVLARPVADLAREEVAGLAVVGQADGGRVDLVQGRDDMVRAVENCGAFRRVHAGQGRVLQDAACLKGGNRNPR